jgi:hypothetical protein
MREVAIALSQTNVAGVGATVWVAHKMRSENLDPETASIWGIYKQILS